MTQIPKLRVVVVDDDPIILRTLKLSLEHALPHAICTTYSDSTAALVELTRDPPHLVITDQSMPGLGGAELARGLRLLGRRCPRVMLISASHVRRSDLVHFDAHFPKPFEMKSIIESIERLFAGASHPRPTTRRVSNATR